MAPSPVPNAPPEQQDSIQALLAGTDSRYVGYARQALGPTWTPMPDPIESMLAQQRRQAAEAARLRAQAEAARRATEQANTFMGAPVTGPLAGVYDAGAAAVRGLGAAATGVADWLTSPAPNANITTDPLGNPLGGSPAPEATRIDVRGTVRGPEKPGFKQDAVYDEQGRVTGWQYTAIPRSPTAPSPGAPMNALDPQNVPHGAMGTEATSAEQFWSDLGREYPEQFIEGKTVNMTVKDAEKQVLANRARIQEQAYGEPVGISPDGVPIYDTSLMRYYGIESDYQAQGWLAYHRPDRLPKNATPSEKLAYVNGLKNMYVAPRYSVGDSANYIMGLDRKGIIDLQKRLKAGGFYASSSTMVVPGFMRMTDVEALQNAMGAANQMGLEVEPAMTLMAKQRAAWLAKQKRGGGYGGGGGGGDITRQVNVQYNQTSLAQGRSLLAGVLEQALGRAPSDQELADFMARLNAAEKKSPTKTITNYVKEGNTQTATSRTKPSTVDPEAMAREFALEINGGSEAFDMQANSYLDNLMNMLMGAQNV
jgi:hypothetical protein